MSLLFFEDLCHLAYFKILDTFQKERLLDGKYCAFKSKPETIHTDDPFISLSLIETYPPVKKLLVKSG
jgi:hypothetical protein